MSVDQALIAFREAPARQVGAAVRFERLERYRVTLSDGHEVGVAVAGRGIPLVMVHGISVTGMLYAQSLARLAGLGFKVFAIDLPGHGDSGALPAGSIDLGAHAEFVGRVIRELGIRRAVLAGHSLGGRIMAELVAEDPELAIALLLVDAPVGGLWDGLIALARWSPPLVSLLGATLAIDTTMTFLTAGPAQAGKLARLGARNAVANLTRPWRVVSAAASVLLAPSSGPTLRRLAASRVPVFFLHGSHDLVVPLRSARDAAARAAGDLVVVRGGAHSWLLEHPVALPAIVAELLQGRLGEACQEAASAGTPGSACLRPRDAEVACLEIGSLASRLAGKKTATLRPFEPSRLSWSIHSHR
ncbi:MAG: alpha/beta fold hydrolase [Acidimicrobiia bacterium]